MAVQETISKPNNELVVFVVQQIRAPPTPAVVLLPHLQAGSSLTCADLHHWASCSPVRLSTLLPCLCLLPPLPEAHLLRTNYVCVGSHQSFPIDLESRRAAQAQEQSVRLPGSRRPATMKSGKKSANRVPSILLLFFQVFQHGLCK